MSDVTPNRRPTVIEIDNNLCVYVFESNYGYSGMPSIEFIDRNANDSVLTIVFAEADKYFEFYLEGVDNPLIYQTDCIALLPAIMKLYVKTDKQNFFGHIYDQYVAAIEKIFPGAIAELGSRL